MKITFVCPPINFSGGIRVIAIYAEQLQQRGHEVSVIATQPKKPQMRQQLRSLLRGKGWIQTPKARPSYIDSSTFSLKIVNHSEPITDADVPDGDVAIATWWETAQSVANLSKTKGAKAYFMQDYGAPGQELNKLIPTWSLPLHIITIAPWMMHLIQANGCNRQVAVVPNAVDFIHFNAPPRSRQTQPTLGFVYRPTVSKGADLACEAVKIARKTLPNLKLIVFGQQYPAQPSLLPTGTDFRIRPTDLEVCQIYASCDGWLFPSRLEGFGLPILEAMACRTPVIGTPAGAAPELITPQTGFLVSYENPQAMAGAIIRLCSLSESEWQNLSEAARAQAASYSWEDATGLFEKALLQAIENSYGVFRKQLA